MKKMVRFAILNGLLPHISNYVTQQQPKTVPELLQAARIAELTTPVANGTNSGVSLQLAGVQEQLQKLTENGMLKLKIKPRLLNLLQKHRLHQHLLTSQVLEMPT